MAKKITDNALTLLTAHDLRTGRSVYWSQAQGWVHSPFQADIAKDDSAQAALLAMGQAQEAANTIVGPYLVEVAYGANNQLEALRLREQHRFAAVPSFLLPQDTSSFSKAA